MYIQPVFFFERIFLMICYLLDLLSDLLWDLMLSFRGSRLCGGELTAKLIMRLAAGALTFAALVLIVIGESKDSKLLIAIGIAGIVAIQVAAWRLERIWFDEYLEDRKRRNKQDNSKIDSD